MLPDLEAAYQELWNFVHKLIVGRQRAVSRDCAADGGTDFSTGRGAALWHSPSEE